MSDIEPIPGIPVDDPESSNRREPSEDRRSRPTPMFSRYLFRGRRRHARREDETQIGYYVDRQTPFELVAVFSLFALTLTDALATLHILGRGGTELNPIMRSALEVGDHYFLITKLGISLLGGVLILIHARFPAVKKSLFALITLYAAVVIYHIFLISSALR